MFKMIGNLPDKDMAILEERIKRVTKTSQVYIDPCMGSTGLSLGYNFWEQVCKSGYLIVVEVL